MKGFTLFSLLIAISVVAIPLLLSWYARGWVALHDSPKYTFDDIPNLQGQVAIVTGANTGIGKVTVRELARKGAKVILTSRSISKGEAAKKDICSAIGASVNCPVTVMELDLSSFENVQQFAEKFRASHSKLDMLILNAGVMMAPYSETAEGLELQIGTNHFGHYFLVDRLNGLLESSKARVVTVSSNAHEISYSGGIRFDQFDSSKGYDQALAYGQSKLANILFSNELSRRAVAKGSGIRANAVHPGFIKTDLARHMNDQIGSLHVALSNVLNLAVKWIYFGAMETDDGALTQLYVATAKEIDNVTGKYFHPLAKLGSTTAQAQDPVLQSRLWEESEKVVAKFLAKQHAREQEALHAQRQQEQAREQERARQEAEQRRRQEEEQAPRAEAEARAQAEAVANEEQQ